MSVGPFTVTDLANALVDRLREAFAEFRLNSPVPDPAEGHEFDSVSIYLGAPPRRGRDENNTETGPSFPMVVVKPRMLTDQATDGAGHSVVTVDMLIGARRLDAEGCLDVIAIVECIRGALLRLPKIADGSRLELPLESEVGEDDAFPQWVGAVSARFTIPQPVSVEEIDTWQT